MPNRIIKESIKKSPTIDGLTWFEEVVFYRIIVTADDYGRLDGRITVLKNELFPTKENITKKNIEDAIGKLVSVGLVRRYIANDVPYLLLPTWELHQRIRNKKSKFPDPLTSESTLTADCGQLTDNCVRNPIQSESESESNTSATAPPENTSKKFIPPTLDDVKAYCSKRKNNVDPKRFLDYFEESGWIDSKGNAVRNWKQKIITWESQGNSAPAKAQPKKNTSYDLEAFEDALMNGRDYTPDD